MCQPVPLCLNHIVQLAVSIRISAARLLPNDSSAGKASSQDISLDRAVLIALRISNGSSTRLPSTGRYKPINTIVG